MKNLYTDNKNQQILQALLKKHGIRKVIASPGGTNPAMVMSLQMDDYFEMYSCLDERSAAYMACGMAVESGEPVILCCTGATASRNYMPALTEAYYRKIPLVVITCSRPNYYVGHLMPQVTNRNIYPADILVCGEHLQTIDTENDSLIKNNVKDDNKTLSIKDNISAKNNVDNKTVNTNKTKDNKTNNAVLPFQKQNGLKLDNKSSKDNAGNLLNNKLQDNQTLNMLENQMLNMVDNKTNEIDNIMNNIINDL